MHMHVDQTRRDDQPGRVDFISNIVIPCGGNAAVVDKQIANFIATIGRVDNPSMANPCRAHVEIPPHR